MSEIPNPEVAVVPIEVLATPEETPIEDATPTEAPRRGRPPKETASKDSGADQVADLKRQLAEAEARINVLVAQVPTPVDPGPAPAPAPQVRLTMFSTKGMHMIRIPHMDKTVQFRKFYPNQPAAAKDIAGNPINTNSFEDGQVAASFYRGSYVTTDPAEIAWFRRQVDPRDQYYHPGLAIHKEEVI